MGQGHPVARHGEDVLRARRGAGAHLHLHVRRRPPPAVLSEDHGATPVEILLVALGACLTGGIASVAQLREIQLRSVKATIAGEHDILGILGADPEVPNRFKSIKVHYDIDADPRRTRSPPWSPSRRSARRSTTASPTRSRSRSRSTDNVPGRGPVPTVTTVVIGAGHSGLAVSRHLAERGVDHVVLEPARGELVAFPALGLAPPAHAQLDEQAARLRLPRRRPGRLHDRSAGAAFIEGYAKESAAPVQADTTVTAVRRADDGYVVETDQETWRAHGRRRRGRGEHPSVPARQRRCATQGRLPIPLKRLRPWHK